MIFTKVIHSSSFAVFLFVQVCSVRYYYCLRINSSLTLVLHNLNSRLNSIHYGHLIVHKNDLIGTAALWELLFFDFSQAVFSVDSLVTNQAKVAPHDFFNHEPIHVYIINNKDLRARARSLHQLIKHFLFRAQERHAASLLSQLMLRIIRSWSCHVSVLLGFCIWIVNQRTAFLWLFFWEQAFEVRVYLSSHAHSTYVWFYL